MFTYLKTYMDDTRTMADIYCKKVIVHNKASSRFTGVTIEGHYFVDISNACSSIKCLLRALNACDHMHAASQMHNCITLIL